jgi:U2-associated protein SR140
MSAPDKVKEFPDISNKLNAPVKKSLYEKQKAEAEAKRKREEAENAAALQEFVTSFDDEAGDAGADVHDGSNHMAYGLQGGMGGAGLGAAPARHFAPQGLRGSGPGSLGPAPFSARKRTLDGSIIQQRDSQDPMFAYEEGPNAAYAESTFKTEHDRQELDESAQDDEKSVPNPRILMSSLPPDISEERIRALLPDKLSVEHVERFARDSDPTERRSDSALITLARNTPARDIDAAVNELQKEYLDSGYYLTISRHLSSAVDYAAAIHSSATSSLPFGAKMITITSADSLNRARPPQEHRGGYAPPASLTGAHSGGQQESYPTLMVEVVVPTDRLQLQLIHKTIVNVLKHGDEFEALLMNNEEVKQDEDWAFLYDARSLGGVYYRYRLWNFLSGNYKDEDPRNRRRPRSPIEIFEGEPKWLPPQQLPEFQFDTYIEDFYSDPEFDSEASDDSDDENPKQQQVDGTVIVGLEQSAEPCYLSPLERARFTHLLARLPTSTGRLRRGDVARVTHFAIAHAPRAAEEIAHMLLLNLERPFALTSASLDYAYDDGVVDDTNYYSDDAHEPQEEEPDDVMESIEKAYEPTKEEGKEDEKANEKAKEKEKEDPSSAKLIALYLISDLIATSPSSGVKNSWKFRPLFEALFKEHRVFERLGRLDAQMSWGKIRADRWRASIQNVLNIWEQWSAFSDTTQKTFIEQLRNPELSPEEKAAAEQKEKEQAQRKAKLEKWKAMKLKEAGDRDEVQVEVGQKEEEKEGVVDETGDLDVYGDEEMPEQDSMKETPIETENQTSSTMQEDVTPSKPHQPAAEADRGAKGTAAAFGMGLTKAALAKQRRPKAVDMFADSDEE